MRKKIIESEFYCALMDFSINLKANTKNWIFIWLDVKNRTAVNNQKIHIYAIYAY